ncbi:hypothetical protein [Pseudomonas sp. USHLN015]|uniref:hypothetical protein n=1 Tax=Pseudomonas sp. USHLN015 TaxID=3081296 RepID=UPI00301DB3DD
MEAIEVLLVTPHVTELHAQALAEGATELAAPAREDSGRLASRLRWADGVLVALQSPMLEP